MKISIEIGGRMVGADLSEPLDISRPLVPGDGSTNAYFAQPPNFTPVVSGNFIGKVTAGSPVNFMNVSFNPHGNGTHTECIGHILPQNENLSDEQNTINKRLQNFHFLCRVISATPKTLTNGDEMISLNNIKQPFEKGEENVDAIAIRTLPNDSSKISRKYSGTIS